MIDGSYNLRTLSSINSEERMVVHKICPRLSSGLSEAYILIGAISNLGFYFCDYIFALA
jgi:hypothetical protein